MNRVIRTIIGAGTGWSNGTALIAGSIALLVISCAKPGLLSDRYPRSFYEIPALLPEGPQEENPTFLVYGDSQGSWLANEKFARRKNWVTWKMALVPVYQLYLLTNGFVGGINWLRYNPDYGERERLMVRDALYREAKHSDIDFLLHLGDMAAHDGRIPGHWADFLRENKETHPLLNEVPMLPTLGNHDRANDPRFGYPNFQAIFGYPRFYSVEFPDAMLFVVDSNVILDQNHHIDDAEQDELFKKWFVSGDPERPAWLEKKLLACDKPFKIVSVHHPPFPFGGHYNDWADSGYGRQSPEKRKLLLDLFRRAGVQIVFSGHEHFYQHSVWRYDENDPGKQMHFIVSSGGGALLRDECSDEQAASIERQLKREGFSVELVNQAEHYHFCRVTVSESELTLSTIAVSRDPELNGSVLEKLIIDRP